MVRVEDATLRRQVGQPLCPHTFLFSTQLLEVLRLCLHQRRLGTDPCAALACAGHDACRALSQGGHTPTLLAVTAERAWLARVMAASAAAGASAVAAATAAGTGVLQGQGVQQRGRHHVGPQDPGPGPGPVHEDGPLALDLPGCAVACLATLSSAEAPGRAAQRLGVGPHMPMVREVRLLHLCAW